MKPSEFLTLLWGPVPAGLVHTWALATKRSYYYRSPYGTDMHAGGVDIYTGVALAHRDHGPHRRTRSDQAVGIAGMWADIDDGKAEDPMEIMRADDEPTILVRSGHGLHAWWLFDEPWIFRDKTEQHDAAVMAAQWQKLLRQQNPGLDSVGDLARLMRLPGTINAKDPENPRRVVVSWSDGPRYPRARLRARAREAGPVHVELGAERAAGRTGPHPNREDGVLQVGGTLDAEQLDLLMEMPEFAVLWNHQRGEKHWSLSEYDMALTNLMAQAGWTDQQLADLITAHRAHWGETAKARRASYLTRTIAKARDTADREALMQRIRDNATTRRAA